MSELRHVLGVSEALSNHDSTGLAGTRANGHRKSDARAFLAKLSIAPIAHPDALEALAQDGYDHLPEDLQRAVALHALRAVRAHNALCALCRC
jgi:hypothetical protein